MILLREQNSSSLKKLIEREHDIESHLGGHIERKKQFSDRLRIYNNRHKQLIQEYIGKVFETFEAKQKLNKHIQLSINLLERVTRVLAVAYNHPPTRELRGVPEDQIKAWRSFYSEAKTSSKGETWGKMSFVCNVLHVIPRLVGPEARLEWVHVYPHNADVIFDRELGECSPSILIWETDSLGAKYIAVDSERWQWLTDKYEVVSEEEHNMGMTPWVEFRFKLPPEDDYWDRGYGQDLADATLEVARIQATKSWVRKGHSSNILYLFLEDEDSNVPSNQVLNNESPLTGKGQIKFGSVENIVSVKDFDDEISGKVAEIAEGYGIPATLIDYQPNSTSDAANVFNPAVNRVYAQLSEIRNSQVKHYEVSELDLAKRVAALLQSHGKFPLGPQEVEASFRVSFPPLTFAESPKAQVETAEALQRMGGTDQYCFFQERHPEYTFEEARERVLWHLDNRSEFLEIVTSRNIPLDPKSDSYSIAQIQGAMGGKVSGETKQIAKEEEDQVDDQPNEIDSYE